MHLIISYELPLRCLTVTECVKPFILVCLAFILPFAPKIPFALAFLSDYCAKMPTNSTNKFDAYTTRNAMQLIDSREKRMFFIHLNIKYQRLNVLLFFFW